MRRSLKFLHTICTIGYAGGLGSYMMILYSAPTSPSLETYTAMRASLGFVAYWLIVPSMLVILISGLLSMAVHFPFHNAPWVWIKAVSGILFFEATLSSIDAPAKEAIIATSLSMAGELDASELANRVRDEWGAWWALLGISAANIALAIWRPKFRRKRDQ